MTNISPFTIQSFPSIAPLRGVGIAAAACKIKYPDRDDVLLMSFDKDTEVAGLFTQSSTAAAPVQWCKEIIGNAGREKRSARGCALIVNSGNANAFTGAAGKSCVEAIAKKCASILKCKREEVFICSTGVIGEPLDSALITNSLTDIARNLQSVDKDDCASIWQNAAHAIMTTDAFPKAASRLTHIGGVPIAINAIAKGAGMIEPDMATMLAFITTDASLPSNILQEILKQANEDSFNSITVDTDQSTNDTVLLFATQKAANQTISSASSPHLDDFKLALKELMIELAQMVVADGEGATKLIEVKVMGAKSAKSAKIIAKNVANSPLVKTAIAGCDANWGRIVMAIGKSQEDLDQEKLSIRIGGFSVASNGAVDPDYDEDKVQQYMKNHKIDIEIDINYKVMDEKQKLKNSATVWTCDLNETYIKINKDYRS